MVETLNSRIKNLRKEKGITRGELAQRLNSTEKIVSKWESGEANPEILDLPILAQLFNVSIDYLLTGTPNRKIPNTDVDNHDDKLQHLFETIPQGIIYQDREGWIISANPAAQRMLGLSEEQLLQRSSFSYAMKTIREDGSPLPVSEHPSMIALHTGKPYGPVRLGVFNEKNKEFIWLSVVATPLYHKGETEPYQVYIIMTDITSEIKARQDYQLLFDEMMDGFALHEIICDENGNPIDYRYLDVNPAFERMTGLKATDIIGKTVLEVLPETEPYWIKTYGQVALTGVPITYQNYSTAINKYFSVTAYRPAPMQFACIVSDQTQQILTRQEKDKALETIRQLANICDIAPSCIVIFDMSGKILYANEFACKLHGCSKDEILSLNVYDLLMNQNNHNLKEIVKEINNKGEIVLNVVACTRQKEPIPLYVYAKKTEWEKQEAILSIGTDLTQKTKADKIIQESLEEKHRILDNLQDGFARADLNGNYLMLNPRMAEIFGYDSVIDMMKTNTKDLYANLKDQENIFKELRTKGKVTNYILKGKRKDQTTLWISMNVQYLRDENGKIIGTEGLLRDVTQRRLLEDEVLKQQESLIKANKVLEKRVEQTINAMSRIVELRDVYTAGHQKRVSELAYEIAKRLGFNKEQLVNLKYGSLIHDIGKLYIPTDILNKPGKITNLEYQIIQTHAEESYNIACEMDLPEVILKMIHQHHERLDGSGYPNHLKGDDIILESRILAVADVVEAMTSHRPYRPALGLDAALREIESGKNIKYDERVVDICIALFRNEGFTFKYEN